MKIYEDKPSTTIELEDGTVKECFIISILKSKYGSYIALMPKEKEYFISGELLLFKLIDNNESEFFGIEDEAEFEYAQDLLNDIILDQGHIQIIEKYKNNYIEEN